MMKTTGRMLLGVAAALLAVVHAANTCDVIMEGAFTRVWQGTTEPPQWQTEDYADSKWKVVSFPIASCPTCVVADGKKSSSFFDPNLVLLSRTEVELKNRVWGGQVSLRVANKAWVWVNGVHVGDVHNPSSCTGEAGFPWKTINIGESILRKGTNHIVVKVLAQSNQGYLDMRLNVKQSESCNIAAVLQCPVIGLGSETRIFRHGFSAAPPRGAFGINFNDSAFEKQSFPLGEYVGRCRRTACFDLNGWLPTNNDKLLTRTKFYLNRVPAYNAYLRVSAVKAWVRVNGVKLGDVNSNDCKWMELGKFFVIPRNLLRRGNNVITVTVSGQVERNVSLALPELNILDTKCPTAPPPPMDKFCPEACADLKTAGFCNNTYIKGKCAATCH